MYSDGILVGNILIKFIFDIMSGDSIVLVFVNLFDNVGKWFFDGGNVIIRKDFVEGGNVIFCFDLEFIFE